MADSVIFHPAAGIDADAVAQAQATLRRRILSAFVGRGHLKRFEAKEMLAYKHSGFSVDAVVCVGAQDRAGLERLLRHGARPPFSMDRLRKAGSELVYRCAKQYSEPGSDKRGAQADELQLTPLELIDRIAALVPPPRTHRHRYYGVLAPTVMRGLEKAVRSDRIGTWWRNPYQITRSISASTGDQGTRHIPCAAGGGCARGSGTADLLWTRSLLGNFDLSNCRLQRGQIAQITCHTWSHAVELPIR